MTLSEVAREAELSRASARRFLHTLVELGYVVTDGRVFALRPQVLELGYAYLSSLTLPEVGAAAPGAARGGGRRVVVGRGARRRRHRLRGPGGDAPHHVGGDPGSAPGSRRPPPRWAARSWPTCPTGARRLPGAPSPCAAHPAHDHVDRGRCARSWTRSASRAGRWSTRSWRRGCGRSRRPCGTGRAVSSRAVNVSAPVRRGAVDGDRLAELLPPLLRAAARDRGGSGPDPRS